MRVLLVRGIQGARGCLRALAVWALLMVPMGSAAARPAGTPGASLKEAIEHFNAGDYAAAQDGFAAVLNTHQDNARTHFWFAYAAHKLGQFDVAAQRVAEAIERDPSLVDARYLAGLLAYQRGEIDAAGAHFGIVVQLAESSALGQSASSYLERIHVQQQVREAIVAIEERRYAEATTALDLLAKGHPDHLQVMYHRAYVDFLQHRYDEARRRFAATVQRHPDDGWSRYMLAVTDLRLGNEKGTTLLEDLLHAPQAEIASAAREELKRSRRAPTGSDLAREAVSTQDLVAARTLPARKRMKWLMFASVDADSNPAYVPESVYTTQGEAAAGLSLGTSAEMELVRRGKSALWLGPRATARLYPRGPREYEIMEVGAQLELTHREERWQVWGALGGSYSWLGLKPFLGVAEVSGGGALYHTDWASTRLRMTAYGRDSQLSEYRNLNGAGARATVSERLTVGDAVWIQLGYVTQAEATEPYKAAWSGPVSGAADATYTADLHADSSFWGHGPRLSGRATLPYRQGRLDASVEYQWRTYPSDEQIAYDVGGDSSTWKGARSDGRTLVSLSASVSIVEELRGFARFRHVGNTSSLKGDADPVDRSFSRSLVLFGVEASL